MMNSLPELQTQEEFWQLYHFIKEYLSVDRKLAKEREKILGLETGTVAVGTAYSVYYKWLSEIIKGFNSRYPGIEVRIVEGKSTKLCYMISEGDMDFAIVSRRENDVKWHHLFFDPLIAVVPNDFCPENGKFNVKNLETHPYIDTYPDIDTDNVRMIKKNAIVPNTCFVTEDTYASQRMVEAGLGVSLSNRVEAAERAAVGNVKLLELEPPYLVEIGIAMSDDDKSSPAAGKFKAYAMENINIQKHSISDIIKR